MKKGLWMPVTPRKIVESYKNGQIENYRKLVIEPILTGLKELTQIALNEKLPEDKKLKRIFESIENNFDIELPKKIENNKEIIDINSCETLWKHWSRLADEMIMSLNENYLGIQELDPLEETKTNDVIELIKLLGSKHIVQRIEAARKIQLIRILYEITRYLSKGRDLLETIASDELKQEINQGVFETKKEMWALENSDPKIRKIEFEIYFDPKYFCRIRAIEGEDIGLVFYKSGHKSEAKDNFLINQIKLNRSKKIAEEKLTFEKIQRKINELKEKEDDKNFVDAIFELSDDELDVILCDERFESIQERLIDIILLNQHNILNIDKLKDRLIPFKFERDVRFLKTDEVSLGVIKRTIYILKKQEKFDEIEDISEENIFSFLNKPRLSKKELYNILKSLELKLENLSEKQRDEILEKLKKFLPKESFHIPVLIETREKPIVSFLLKIIRKKVSSPEEITDIRGIKFICINEEDFQDALSVISKYFKVTDSNSFKDYYSTPPQILRGSKASSIGFKCVKYLSRGFEVQIMNLIDYINQKYSLGSENHRIFRLLQYLTELFEDLFPVEVYKRKFNWFRSFKKIKGILNEFIEIVAPNLYQLEGFKDLSEDTIKENLEREFLSIFYDFERDDGLFKNPSELEEDISQFIYVYSHKIKSEKVLKQISEIKTKFINILKEEFDLIYENIKIISSLLDDISSKILKDIPPFHKSRESIEKALLLAKKQAVYNIFIEQFLKV